MVAIVTFLFLKVRKQEVHEQKTVVNQDVQRESKQLEKTPSKLENYFDADKKDNIQKETKPDEVEVKREPKKPKKEEKAEHKKNEAALKLEQERTVKEKEGFLNKYLQNRSYKNSAEFNDVAILVINEKNEIAKNINSQIASLMRENSAKTVNLFSSAFITDGLFEKVSNGDTNIIDKLELSKYCDNLILGKVTESFTKDSGLENLITANLTFEANIISSSNGEIKESFVLEGVGPGFTKEEAKKYAITEIIKNLSKKLKGFHWR